MTNLEAKKKGGKSAGKSKKKDKGKTNRNFRYLNENTIFHNNKARHNVIQDHKVLFFHNLIKDAKKWCKGKKCGDECCGKDQPECGSREHGTCDPEGICKTFSGDEKEERKRERACAIHNACEEKKCGDKCCGPKCGWREEGTCNQEGKCEMWDTGKEPPKCEGWKARKDLNPYQKF